MSKIALTPNASGTGVFTIASPATNTDRTLTLPDEAGTVLTSASSLASANLTGAVTVSGSNVGIGTASPDALLDVSRSGNGQIAVLQTSANRGFSFESQSDTALQIASVQGSTNLDLWANTLTFSAGNTERMRIDSSGNVGIGTSSPSAQGLHILSSAGVGAISQPYATLNIENSTGDPMMIMSGTSGGIIASMNNSQAATPLRFYTGQTERMRINSSGDLLVGTTVVGQPNANAMAYDTGGMMRLSRVNGNTGNYIYFIYNGLGIGSISNNGGSAVAYNTSSDYRLKTDAQPMTGASARVQALNPVNFEWIADGTRVDGFLAHEAQTVVPEAVTGTKDAMRDEEYEVTPAVLDDDGNVVTEAVMGTRSVPDYQGIDQSKLVPLLTAALQEALTKIDAMETRLAALEAE